MSPLGGGPRWVPGDAGQMPDPQPSAHVLWWTREQWEAVRGLERAGVLRAAADKLDAHAAANDEGVHEYTDLLRVWADDKSRWKAGS